jgi:hypothetical protein
MMFLANLSNRKALKNMAANEMFRYDPIVELRELIDVGFSERQALQLLNTIAETARAYCKK